MSVRDRCSNERGASWGELKDAKREKGEKGEEKVHFIGGISKEGR